MKFHFLWFSAITFSHASFTSASSIRLFRQPRNRYLSAACFFLLVNHSIELLSLENDQSIFLQCRKKVYEEFYAQLSDFNFAITRSGQGENVDVMSPCPPLCDLDNMMIIKLQALPI